MSRALPKLRLRQLRWVVCAAALPALWACNARRLASPMGTPTTVEQNRFQQSLNRKIDLLFMIDDSSSMTGLQTKLTTRFPDFIDTLDNVTGGRPDMHIATISSSLGAGIFGNVMGCMPGHPGNDEGSFQVPALCSMVHAGERYLKASAVAGTNNFDGDLAAAFTCIASLGATGCGFEHQFASTQEALTRSLTKGDPNEGFLRPDAFLAVIMLTNEDDCSVPPTSMLFDPNQVSLSDPLGGLSGYRCNEFGHLCNGVQPPHVVSGPTTLNNCVSAEDAPSGQLVTVKDFTEFLYKLKPGEPGKILTAALAGPYVANAAMGQPGAYTIAPTDFQLMSGATESQPVIGHSCVSATPGDFADPGVRLVQWITETSGVFESICENDFKPAMQQIAGIIGRKLGVPCVNGTVLDQNGAPWTDGDASPPNCEISVRTYGTDGKPRDKVVDPCDHGTGNVGSVPCYRLTPDSAADPQCPAATGDHHVLDLCYDAGCTAAARPSDTASVGLSCALQTP